MSRAHMLYDDQPLQQGPVHTTRWEGTFKQSDVGNAKLVNSAFFLRLVDDLNPNSFFLRGPGILLEGSFMSKKKHIIADSTGKKVIFSV